MTYISWIEFQAFFVSKYMFFFKILIRTWRPNLHPFTFRQIPTQFGGVVQGIETRKENDQGVK